MMPANDKSYKTLELDKVLNLASEYTQNSDSKNIILNTVPCFDFEYVKEELSKTDEAYVVIKRYGQFVLGDIKSPKEDLKLSRIGAVLSNKSLLNISEILHRAYLTTKWRQGMDFDYLKLDEYFDKLKDEKELRSEIKSKIIDEDNVSDNASESLSNIRKTLKRKRQNLRNVLSEIVGGKYKKFLTQSLVTMRNGRYVIPVKSECKREIRGITHDVSSSGATVFIEPESVVEANNEIKVLEIKEEEEIKKILLYLTNKVKKSFYLVLADYKTLITLDVYFAKGKYAIETNSVKPLLNNRMGFNLKKARHPLLDDKVVVPIDVRIGYENKILIITGPNTGGKTVALKTIGLFELMIGCGLLILADEGSEISLVSNVLVNIGDEQSIEQSLSTFSADIKNISHILKTADNRSLILLDELGAGTDPDEGAALAIAVIDYLLKRGSVVAATTHYPALKVYGMETEGIESGSFEFDMKSLKPTYKLKLGIPGSSNAFLISQRIGLSEEVLNRAKEELTVGKRNFEDTLKRLEQKTKSLEAELEKQKKINVEIEGLKKRIQDENNIRNERANKQTENLQNSLEYAIDKVKEEANGLLNAFKSWEKEKKKDNPKDFILKTKGRVSKTLEEISGIEESLFKEETKTPSGEDYNKGDLVLIAVLGQKGTVTEPPDKNGKLTVLLSNGIKTRVKKELLKPTGRALKRPPTVVTKTLNNLDRKVRLEIDVRGKNKEEAIDDIGSYIDECLINGLSEATIIHGTGTGVLKREIRRYLKRNKNVEGFRAGRFGEGEDGVTVITLK